jgi:hypothetical protein
MLQMQLILYKLSLQIFVLYTESHMLMYQDTKGKFALGNHPFTLSGIRDKGETKQNTALGKHPCILSGVRDKEETKRNTALGSHPSSFDASETKGNNPLEHRESFDIYRQLSAFFCSYPIQSS